jgi:hypothetical protein
MVADLRLKPAVSNRDVHSPSRAVPSGLFAYALSCDMLRFRGVLSAWT